MNFTEHLHQPRAKSLSSIESAPQTLFCMRNSNSVNVDPLLATAKKPYWNKALQVQPEIDAGAACTVFCCRMERLGVGSFCLFYEPHPLTAKFCNHLHFPFTLFHISMS